VTLPHEPAPGGAEGTGAADSQLAEPLRELAGQPAEVQQRLGYADTLREICQQPATWRETSRDMVQQGPRLTAFLR